MKSYETEARERYGNTAAYREHEQKTKNYILPDSVSRSGNGSRICC